MTWRPVTSSSHETTRPSDRIVTRELIRPQGRRPEGDMSATATSGICPPQVLGPRITADPTRAKPLVIPGFHLRQILLALGKYRHNDGNTAPHFPPGEQQLSNVFQKLRRIRRGP